jgi:hypothetical protein
MRASFGIAAGQQQAKIRGLMGMAGKLPSTSVRDFGEQDAAQFEAALRCSVESSGLQRIAHWRWFACRQNNYDSFLDA